MNISTATFWRLLALFITGPLSNAYTSCSNPDQSSRLHDSDWLSPDLILNINFNIGSEPRMHLG